MSAFGKAVESEVFRRQKGVCASCGTALMKLLEETEMNSVQYHHVQPKVLGGNNEADNCVALCTYTSPGSKDGCHYHVHQRGNFKSGAVAGPDFFKYSHGHQTASHLSWVTRWKAWYGFSAKA